MSLKHFRILRPRDRAGPVLCCHKVDRSCKIASVVKLMNLITYSTHLPRSFIVQNCTHNFYFLKCVIWNYETYYFQNTKKGTHLCALYFRRLHNFLHDLLSTIESRQPSHREAVRSELRPHLKWTFVMMLASHLSELTRAPA